jgi:hypothetical protein
MVACRTRHDAEFGRRGIDEGGSNMTATSIIPTAGPVVVPIDEFDVATSVRVTTRTRVVRALVAVGILLAVVGGVLVGTGGYVHRMIGDQLADQQIFFPPAGSPGLPADAYPGLQQYGGQLLDTGPEARAWADQFMRPHILELSDGQAYGAFSAQAFMNPNDEAMQATSKLMAIGEVQRGLLLSAWGWWTVGTVTSTAGIALVVVGLLAVAIGAAIRFWRPRRIASI